jgi:hypothetical protein
LISLAGFTRRRRALVAAFLPYLLLSLFVDFVHLHRLFAGDMTVLSGSQQHVAAVTPGQQRLPDAPCAICQWLRAGTGLQTSTTAHFTFDSIAAALAPLPTSAPFRPTLGAPDFRGPPLPSAL